MNKVALVIIYNHQFNKNIEVIEKIYAGRFSNIFHLVPFYKGDRPNVIAVYECSYFFNGYVAQGLNNFFSTEFGHYFFIGDDLIINPAIDENNYKDFLALDAHSCFIPRLSSIDENKNYWANNITALFYNKLYNGVEAEKLLPDNETAKEKMQSFGVHNKPLEFYQIWKLPASFIEWLRATFWKPRFVLRYLYSMIRKKKYTTAYPLARSYADMFVISADAIKEFSNYCGLFSATRLFVELAIPTAMVFSAKKIVTEKDLLYKGKALWNEADYSILNRYDHNLNALFNNFPENCLYIHPVKLSKWKYQ